MSAEIEITLKGGNLFLSCVKKVTYKMKKVLTLALAVLMLAVMAIPSFAATGTEDDPIDLKMGTPEVDGVLDEAYRENFYIEIDNATSFYPIGEGTTDTLSARSYFLWDYSYFYICTVVQDNNIYTRGQTWHELEEDPWQDDVVEFWIKDGMDFKVHCDAYGYAFYTGNGVATFDSDDAHYFTTVDKENNTYTVEMALPLPDLEEGRTFGVSLQVNSIDETENGGAYQNKDGFRYTVRMGGEEVSTDEKVTTPEESTTESQTTPAEVTTPEESTTEPVTDPPETTTTAANTTKEPATTAKTEEGGCGSVVGVSSALVIAAVASTVLLTRKKSK